MSTPSAFETYSIQIDPSNGAYLFEFNKHLIQPMIRFPKKASNRKFVSAWYTKHKWLEYSVMEDKAYCHFCRIFSGNKDFIFEKSGFNDWTHACAGLDKHEKTAIHKSTEIAFNNRVMQDY